MGRKLRAAAAAELDELDELDVEEELDELDEVDDVDDDEEEQEPAGDLEEELEQGLEAADEEEAPPEPPVSEVLGARTLAGMKARMRKEPLSRQANEWVLATLMHVVAELIDRRTGTGTRAEHEIVADVDVLVHAVEARGIQDEVPRATWINAGVALAARNDAPVTRTDADSTSFQVTDAGRAALTGSRGDLVDEGVIHHLSLASIERDPAQARDEGADDELADSIAANGVLQPIRVYAHPAPHGAVQWMIEDGERRYLGSLKAGRAEIPARVVDAPEDIGEKLLHQVTLNDGKRLKPLEEARTWKRILEAKGWSLQELAKRLARAKSTVSDRLAILEAPAPFHKLFEAGVLTAAAAPIVRQFASVPAANLERAIESAEDDWKWDDAVRAGKPLPLADAKRVLEQIIFDEELAEIPGDFDGAYAGEVITIKGKRYATDRAKFDQVYDKWDTARRAKSAKGSPAAAPAPKRREPDRYALQQRAAMKAAKKKGEQRRAQFLAISAKLPTSLDGDWSLFLVTHLVDELSTDGMRNAVKGLAINIPKGSVNGGFTSGLRKALLGYAAMLPNAGARAKLALQLLLAHDLYVSPHSNSAPQRLTAAAKLLKLDLAKIQAPDPAAEKSAAAAKPVPAAKKKTPRRAVADFMKPHQPDAALGAVIGMNAMPRTEVTKKLWAYIKKHKLQDVKERRMINADAKLKLVFDGKSRLSMFDMTKAINKHLSPGR